MDLAYIESDIGKKKLKEIKRINRVYMICTTLISLIYVILCLGEKINAIITCSIIYVITIICLTLIIRKHTVRFTIETLTQEICLDGFINISIYFIKKTEKKLKWPISNRAYNNSLLNLIYGYLRKGDYEQADEIIKVLDNRQLYNDAKALLIRYKAEMAYEKNNKEEFDIQYRKLEDMSNIISLKVKNTIFTSLDLKKNIFENNEEEVGKICDQLINSDVLLNKVMSFYYKGLVLEKNNKEGYEDYYKFVAENGNDLDIAKYASKKLGIEQNIKYKPKKYIGFKIFSSLLIIILTLSTIYISAIYIEIVKVKKWDTGVVYINERKVNLPCTISEFEKTMNEEIDRSEIMDSYFYNFYLVKNRINMGGYYTIYGKFIELSIKDDMITGVRVDISNSWNDELDTELGNMVVFPEEITANSSIETIQNKYKTGSINPAMRDWSEDIVNNGTGETTTSYGFQYSGDKYDISIDCEDGKVKSIFYYYR